MYMYVYIYIYIYIYMYTHIYTAIVICLYTEYGCVGFVASTLSTHLFAATLGALLAREPLFFPRHKSNHYFPPIVLDFPC